MQLKSLKGISLPVNLIVILAVAIIVLLIAVTFLIPFVFGPGIYIRDDEAWRRGCMIWQQRGCRAEDIENIIIENYDPDGDNKFDNLLVACRRALRYTNPEDCRRACCIIPEGKTQEQQQT
ncbi:MAG: hypothetical protein QXJ96_01560 [Candidatus Aenigmatarchaeota archaeon]|nr:hypothetical protein [Candidatus Aenigmarchaeota archaeon]